jgi:hypothetical protein
MLLSISVRIWRRIPNRGYLLVDRLTEMIFVLRQHISTGAAMASVREAGIV